ncbi:MAG: glycine cleavage system aminomethyltransferase GcvT [Sphingomicrobium sp.]
MAVSDTENTKTLALDGWHRAKGARMVPFAGYDMPVQYEGVIAEHLWTRQHAGLFDVSHMGQLTFHGSNVDSALETLMPGDLQILKEGRLRYSMLLDENGGIVDDLMATRRGDHFYVVVNGATKQGDIEQFENRLPRGIVLDHLKEQSLLALQGPEAVAVVDVLAPGVADLSFMQAALFEIVGVPAWISRSGYTGEDGVEISVPSNAVEKVADALVADERVKPIGLGARDSLRLEAGLPLYGHDLDRETTPVMADLGFAVGKRRRAEGGFAGAARIIGELDRGSVTKRVGLSVDGRQPVREGAMVLDREANEVGKVTSGTFSPSLQRCIAMAYVPLEMAEVGATVKLSQRGKLFQATVVAMPFVPHKYHRKPAGA